MKNKMKVNGNIYCAGVYGMRVRDSKDYLYCGSGLEMNDCLQRHLYFLKRGLYIDTNKAILQKYYDMGELVFEVIKQSAFSSVDIGKMSAKEKENLQKELSVLEEFYIGLYKNTVCNKQKSVTKHSSNKDEFSTIRRHNANTGNKNPHVKYDEKLISNILWLKETGYKPKQIEKMYSDYGIKSSYIAAIGIWKWAELEPVKPDFDKEKETSTIGVDEISDALENAK